MSVSPSNQKVEGRGGHGGEVAINMVNISEHTQEE